MKKHIVVFFVFFVLLGVMTYPLIFKITTCTPGFSSTIEIQPTLWDAWRIKYSFLHGFPLGFTKLIAYPFGMHFYSSGYKPYIWIFWHYSLSMLTTPILTWNIPVLLNMFLSCILMYLLVFRLTGRKIVGLFSGIAFAFCPYQFARLWQHLGLTYNELLPLVLLSVISLRENSSWERKVRFIMSLLLLYSFDLHMMFFGSFILFCYLFYTLLSNWRNKIRCRRLFHIDFIFVNRVASLWAIALLILFFQFMPIIINTFKLSHTTPASGYNTYRRKFDDLFTQSAKPLSYFLPSTEHPLLGGLTNRLVGSPLWGVSLTEHQLYLGWTVILLALYAVRKWRKKRKMKLEFNNDEKKDNFYIGFFLFLAVAAWIFSQPPWWNFVFFRIYMPSFFLYKILPMIRAYCRFGIVVMLAVSILAGYGLRFLMGKFKYIWQKVVVAGLCCCLVLFEFWNWPPYKIIDMSRAPKVYYWLKRQKGEFAVAEYPLDTNGSNDIYKFYQIFHQKPIINCTIPFTYPNKIAKTITKLSSPKTASILKWMGVKYVLVHRQAYLDSDIVKWVNELKKIPKNPKLKFIKSFPAQKCPDGTMCAQKSGPIDVYKVIALPSKPHLFVSNGSAKK